MRPRGTKAFPASSSLARWALFVVYTWFGLLKVVGLSPASDLVRALQLETLSFLDFGQFFVVYGGVEMLIGILVLFPRATPIALTILAGHVATTLLPLLVLPDIAWQRFLVPTLEGQYILKNVLILAAAATILQGDAPPAPAERIGELRPAVEPPPGYARVDPLEGGSLVGTGQGTTTGRAPSPPAMP